MMKRMIVSTSTSCLDYLEKPANVVMLPMNIHMGGIDYLDGKTITINQLSQFMLNNPNSQPTTSAPNENQLIDFFYDLVKKDIQEVLVVAMSSFLSKTLSNILEVRDFLSNRLTIHVYDTRAVSHPEALLVYEASRLLNTGMRIPDIVSHLDDMRKRMRMYITIDTLSTMIRTKRISAPAGFFANLLDIKPVVEVADNGEVKAYEKQKGIEKSLYRLGEIITTESAGKNGQMYVMGNEGNPYLQQLVAILRNFGYTDTLVFPIASVSVANIGVYAIGVAFVES